MPCTWSILDRSFVQAVWSIAGVFLTMTEEDAGGRGGGILPVLDWIGAILCTAGVNATPVALRLPHILLGFTTTQAALVHGAKHIISAYDGSARQHGTLLVLPTEALSTPVKGIPPSTTRAARCLAGLMDDAASIGKVLTILAFRDGAFVVPA